MSTYMIRYKGKLIYWTASNSESQSIYNITISSGRLWEDLQEAGYEAVEVVPRDAATAAERDALRASLRVLLDWCETFLNDEKHLIGSICKEADDAQFKAAIEQARTAIEEAIPASSVCTTCGELVPQGCCTCGPRQRLA